MANDEELALQGEVEENQAIISYDKKAQAAKSPKMKETFKDLKEEEEVHKGELLQRAEEVDPKLKELMEEGVEEAKEIKKNSEYRVSRRGEKGMFGSTSFDESSGRYFATYIDEKGIKHTVYDTLDKNGNLRHRIYHSDDNYTKPMFRRFDKNGKIDYSKSYQLGPRKPSIEQMFDDADIHSGLKSSTEHIKGITTTDKLQLKEPTEHKEKSIRSMKDMLADRDAKKPRQYVQKSGGGTYKMNRIGTVFLGTGKKWNGLMCHHDEPCRDETTGKFKVKEAKQIQGVSVEKKEMDATKNVAGIKKAISKKIKKAQIPTHDLRKPDGKGNFPVVRQIDIDNGDFKQEDLGKEIVPHELTDQEINAGREGSRLAAFGTPGDLSANATNPKLYPLIVDTIYGSKTNGIYDHELFRDFNVRGPNGETVLNTLKNGWLQSYNHEFYRKSRRKPEEYLYRYMDEDLISFLKRCEAHVQQIYGKNSKWTVTDFLQTEFGAKKEWRFIFNKIYDMMYEKGLYRPSGRIGARSDAFARCPISDPSLDDILMDFFEKNPRKGKEVYVKLCQTVLTHYNKPVKEIIERQGTPTEDKVWDVDYHEDELGMPDGSLSSTSQFIPAYTENVMDKNTGEIKTEDRTISTSTTPVYTAILPHQINMIINVTIRQKVMPDETFQSIMEKNIQDFIRLRMRYERVWRDEDENGVSLDSKYRSQGYSIDDVALNSLVESICAAMRESGIATEEEITDFRDLTRVSHGGQNEYLTSLWDEVNGFEPYPVIDGLERRQTESTPHLLRKQDKIVSMLERHANWFSNKSDINEFVNAKKHIIYTLMKRAREESAPGVAEYTGDIVGDNLFRGLLGKISSIQTSWGEPAFKVPTESLNRVEARHYSRRGKKEFPYVQVLDKEGYPLKKIRFHPTILDNNFEKIESPTSHGSINRPTMKENDFDIYGNQLFETGNRKLFKGKDGMFWLGDERETQIPIDDFKSGKYKVIGGDGVIDGYDDGTGGTIRYINTEGNNSSHFVRLNVITRANKFDDTKKTLVPYYVRANKENVPNLMTEEQLKNAYGMDPIAIENKKFINQILSEVGGLPGNTASNPLLGGDLLFVGTHDSRSVNDITNEGKEMNSFAYDSYLVVKPIDILVNTALHDNLIITRYAVVYDSNMHDLEAADDGLTRMFTKKDLKRFYSGNFSNGGATFDGISHGNFSRAMMGQNEKGENVVFGVDLTPWSEDMLEFTDELGSPINVQWDNTVKAYVDKNKKIVDPQFAKVRRLKDVRDYDQPSTMSYDAYNAYLDAGFPVSNISEDEAAVLGSQYLEGRKGKNGVWGKFDPQLYSKIPNTKKLDFVLFKAYINSRVRDGTIYHEVDGHKIDLKPGVSGKTTIEDVANQLSDDELQKYAEEAWAAIKEVYDCANMAAKLEKSPMATIEDATSGGKENPSSGKTVEDKNEIRLMYVAEKLLKWLYSSPSADESIDEKRSIYMDPEKKANVVKGILPGGTNVGEIGEAFENKITKHNGRVVDGSYIVEDQDLKLDDEVFDETYMGLEGMGDEIENLDQMTPYEQIKSFIHTGGMENIRANRMVSLENVLNKTYDIIKDNLYTYWENNGIEIHPGEFDDLFAKALISELSKEGNEYLLWMPPGIQNVFKDNHYLTTKIQENLKELSDGRYYKANPMEKRPIDPALIKGTPEYYASQSKISTINGFEGFNRTRENNNPIEAKFFIDLKKKMDQGKPLYFVDMLIANKMFERLERKAKNTIYVNQYGDLTGDSTTGLVYDIEDDRWVPHKNKKLEINQVLPFFYAVLKGLEIYKDGGPEEYKQSYDKLYGTYESDFINKTTSSSLRATEQIFDMLADPYNSRGVVFENTPQTSVNDRLLDSASGYVKQRESPKTRTDLETAADNRQLGMNYFDQRFNKEKSIEEDQRDELIQNKSEQIEREYAFKEMLEKEIENIEKLKFEQFVTYRDIERGLEDSVRSYNVGAGLIGLHGMDDITNEYQKIAEKEFMIMIHKNQTQLDEAIMNFKKLLEIPQFYPGAFSKGFIEKIRGEYNLDKDGAWWTNTISSPIRTSDDIQGVFDKVSGRENTGAEQKGPPTTTYGSGRQQSKTKRYILRPWYSGDSYYLTGDSKLYGDNGYVTIASNLYKEYAAEKKENDDKLESAFKTIITTGIPEDKKRTIVESLTRDTKFWQKREFLKNKYREYLAGSTNVTDKDLELVSKYLGIKGYGAALLGGRINLDEVSEDPLLLRLDREMRKRYPYNPSRYTDSPGVTARYKKFAPDMLYWALKNPKMFEMITGQKYSGRPFEDSDLSDLRLLDDEQIARRNAHMDAEKEKIRDSTLDTTLRRYVAAYLHMHHVPKGTIDAELGPVIKDPLQPGKTIGIDGLLTTERANQILNKYGISDISLPNRDDVHKFNDIIYGLRDENRVKKKIQDVIKWFSTPIGTGKSALDEYNGAHPDSQKDVEFLLNEWNKLPEGELKERLKRKIDRAILPNGTGQSLLDLFNKNNHTNIRVREKLNDDGAKELEMYVKSGDNEYPVDPSKFFNELLPENYDYVDEDGFNVSEWFRNSIGNIKTHGGRRKGMPLEFAGRKEQGLARPITHEERLIYNGQAPMTGSLPEERVMAAANGFTGENAPKDVPLHGDDEGWFAQMFIKYLLGNADKHVDMTDFKTETPKENETLESAIADGYSYKDGSRPILDKKIDDTVTAVLSERRGNMKPKTKKTRVKEEKKKQKKDLLRGAKGKKADYERGAMMAQLHEEQNIRDDIMDGTIPIKESARKREKLIFLMKELHKIEKSSHCGRRDFYINLGLAAKNCSKIAKANNEFDFTVEDVGRQLELGKRGTNIGSGVKPTKIKIKQTKYPWIEKLTGDDMIALRTGKTTPNLEDLKKNHPELYAIAAGAYGRAEGYVSAKNKRGGPGFFGGRQAMNNNLFIEWKSLMEKEADRQHPTTNIKRKMKELEDTETLRKLLEEHEKKGDLHDIIREGVLKELGRPFSEQEKMILNRIALNRGLSEKALRGDIPKHNVVPYVPGQFEPERLNRFDLITTKMGYVLPDVFRYGSEIIPMNEFDYNTYANLFQGVEDSIVDKAEKENKSVDEIRALANPNNIWGKFKLITHVGDIPIDLTWGPPDTDLYKLHYGKIGLGRYFEEQRDDPMVAAQRSKRYGSIGGYSGSTVSDNATSSDDDLGDRVDYGGDFDGTDD